MKIRKKRYSSVKRSRFSTRKLIILAVVALVVVGLALAISHHNSSNKTKSQMTTVSSKGEQAIPTTTASGSDKSTGTSTSSSSSPSGEVPKTPYGSFVSSHSAGSGDSELSTCLTSAGAKCMITFTKGGVSKTLDEKTTDSDGAAYWNWKPQDIGLSTGSWQIMATASNNGQTATATDTRNLTIQ